MAKKSKIDSTDYYLKQQIDADGIAKVGNPAALSKNYNPWAPRTIQANVGDFVTGTSKHDEYLGNIQNAIDEGFDVEDLRYNSQSGFDIAANALVQNVGIAGSSAVAGTLGVLNGLMSAVWNKDASKIWDNTINNWAVDVQDSLRENFAIHRGGKYNDSSIWNKMGNGVFWGELFANLGFTEGMLIPGMLTGGLLSGAPQFLAKTIPSLVSAIGEGSVEAINNRNDEVKTKTQMANDQYNKLMAQAKTPEEQEALYNEYLGTVNDINEDARKAGNFVLGANIAVLTLSNAIQFGDLFARGFDTSKRLTGSLIRESGKYSVESLGKTLGRVGGESLLNATSEGLEEVSQKVISNTPKNYDDYNSFNKSKFNPEKRELVSSLVSSLGKSISETLHDDSTAEEFAMGFLTGALGVPTFKKSAMPIRLENNIFADMYSAVKQRDKQSQLADTINARLQDDKKFKAYYEGLTRKLAIQDEKSNALENDDVLEYKNAESREFINDALMFEEAGDIDYFKALIQDSVDLSDKGIQAIIKDTTDASGNGPFSRNGVAMDTKDVREAIQKKQNNLLGKIDNYLVSRTLFEQAYPKADEETIKNMVFINSQIQDRSERVAGLVDSAYEKFQEIAKGMPKVGKKHYKKVPKGQGVWIIDQQGKKQYVFKSDIDHYDDNGRAVLKKEYDPASFTKEKFVENWDDKDFRSLIAYMAGLNSNTASIEAKQNILKEMEDVDRLYESIESYNKQFKEVSENLNTSSKKAKENEEEAVANHTEKELKKTAETINGMDMRQLTARLEQTPLSDEERAALSEENRKKVEEAEKINKAKQDIHTRIDADPSLSASAKAAMHKTVNATHEAADTFQEMLDAEVFDEDLLDVQLPYNEEEIESLRQQLESGEIEQSELDAFLAQEKENIKHRFNEIMQEYKDNLAEVNEVLGKKTEIKSGEEKSSGVDDETGADPTGKVAAVDTAEEKKELTVYTTFEEAGDEVNSQQEVTTANDVDKLMDEEDEQREREANGMPKSSEGNNFWKTNTTQEVTSRGEKKLGLKRGHHTPFHKTSLDKNSALHEKLWNYLNNCGAFTRLNQGLVHKGTEDKPFKVRIGTDLTLNKNTGQFIPLVMVEDPENPGKWVVVGDMISNGDIHSQFPHYDLLLNSLQAKLAEYKGSDNLVDLGMELTVNDVLLGRPNYSAQDKRHTLNEIAQGKKFYIGVSTGLNGPFIVDSKKIKGRRTTFEQRKVRKPKAPAKGQPYILVGDEQNGFMPVPIRMPKFNKDTAGNSLLGREVLDTLGQLDDLDVTPTQSIFALKREIEAVLGLDQLWIGRATPKEGQTKGDWVISYRVPGGTVKTLRFSESSQGISEKVIEDLHNAGINYQVDIKRMNDSSETIEGRPYNEAIGEIAETNLEIGGLNLINNFPLFNYFNEKGEEVGAKKPKGETYQADKMTEAQKKATGLFNAIRERMQGLVRPTKADNHYTFPKTGKHQRVHSVMPNNSKNAESEYSEDEITNPNAKRAVIAGTEVDRIVREFFLICYEDMYANSLDGIEDRIEPNEAIISKEAYVQLIKELKALKKELDKKGERVFSEGFVLNHNYGGLKVAGEVDLITIDKNGKFRIYDMKTSKDHFTESNYSSPNRYQNWSTREEHGRQLGFYAKMLKDSYGIDVVELKILPFFVEFDEYRLSTYDDSKTYPIRSLKLETQKKLALNTRKTTSLIERYKKAKGIGVFDPKDKISKNLTKYFFDSANPNPILHIANGQNTVQIQWDFVNKKWDLKVKRADGSVVTQAQMDLSDAEVKENVSKLLEKDYIKFFESGQAAKLYAKDDKSEFNNILSRYGLEYNTKTTKPKTNETREDYDKLNDWLKEYAKKLKHTDEEKREAAEVIRKLRKANEKKSPFKTNEEEDRFEYIRYKLFEEGFLEETLKRNTISPINFYKKDIITQDNPDEYNRFVRLASKIHSTMSQSDLDVKTFMTKFRLNEEEAKRLLVTYLIFLETGEKIEDLKEIVNEVRDLADKLKTLNLTDSLRLLASNPINAAKLLVTLRNESQGPYALNKAFNELASMLKYLSEEGISFSQEIINLFNSGKDLFSIEVSDGVFYAMHADFIQEDDPLFSKFVEFYNLYNNNTENGNQYIRDYVSDKDARNFYESFNYYKYILKKIPTIKPTAPIVEEKKGSLENREAVIKDLSKKTFLTKNFTRNKQIIEKLNDEQVLALSEMKNIPTNAKKWDKFIRTVKPADSEAKIREEFNKAFGTKFSETRGEEAKPYKKWDKKSELKVLSKMLPNLSKRGRVRIVESIERVAGKDNPSAWGKYLNGIITLYENAIEGTSFHEAFHYVVDALLSPEEQSDLFDMATYEFGDKSVGELEENMADAFKEYVLLREDAGFGQRIMNFFKDLYYDLKHLFKAKDSLTAMYSRIYRGKYANRTEHLGSNITKYSSSYTKEMLDIKEQAIKKCTYMKAPKGQPTKLNERQWLQVRTKAFKEWFGDWENVGKFNINAIDTSKVDIEEVDKPWKKNNTKSNKTIRIYLKNQHDKGYFELVKDEEFGMYSVHFKTVNEKGLGTTGANPSTKEERAILYEQLINAIPNGAQVSTWGEVSKGGEIALNKVGHNMTKVGERTVTSKSNGQPISIPIYQKGEGVSKVVDENGEPKIFIRADDLGSTELKLSEGLSFATNNLNVAGSYASEDSDRFDGYANFKNPYIVKEQSHGYFIGDKSAFELKEDLISKGYDGIIFEKTWDAGNYADDTGETDYWATNVVFFNKNQFKSATDNIGTFRRDTNDIRFSLVKGSRMYESLESNEKELLNARGLDRETWNLLTKTQQEYVAKCVGITL